jgi:UDP-2,3-diacylglucosamine hydrolase
MGSSTPPHSLFISDLHLSADRPDITAALLRFLAGPARGAEALYILGDLFEVWIGDDTLDEPLHTQVAEALRALSQASVAVRFQHGNRDFLLAQDFCARSGATVLADPSLITLGGIPTLLMHGDTLCTDDVAYQAFRRQVRDPAFQKHFLAQPIPVRRAMAGEARKASEGEKRVKTAEIMDVSPATVESVLRTHDYPRLIHGHTHRPAQHRHEVDGHVCERWVLSDWDRGGDCLRVDATGITRIPIPL